MSKDWGQRVSVLGFIPLGQEVFVCIIIIIICKHLCLVLYTHTEECCIAETLCVIKLSLITIFLKIITGSHLLLSNICLSVCLSPKSMW